MGLEIAEFVIALEDKLEIRFDDASPFDAETEVTVAMMVDYVERKIREKETDELMAEDYPFKVFEQTAAILALFAEVSPNDITPETLLTDLFPDAKRWRNVWRVKGDERLNEMYKVLMIQYYDGNIKNLRKIWHKEGFESNEVKLDLSQGRRDPGVLPLKTRMIIFFLLVTPSLYIFPALTGLITGIRTVGMAVMVLCPAILFFWLLRYGHIWFNKIKRFPLQGVTVGLVSAFITAHRRRFLAPDGSPMTRSAIELRVIEILADIIAIKPNDIMFTDRLVQDLKMG